MAQLICALFRQSWYELAHKYLQPIELLELYEAAFRFEFYDEEPHFSSQQAAILFDSFRETIVADKAKAIARAERNRKNGSLGGRPKNPNGFFGLAYNNNNNNNNNNNISFSQTTENEGKDKQKEIFCIYLSFFERGFANVEEEYLRFNSYYSARGWTDRAGNAIKSRIALANLWETKQRSSQMAANRAFYCQLLKASQTLSLPLIGDYLGLFINEHDKSIIIRFKCQETAMLFDEQVTPKIIKFLPSDDNKKPFNLSFQIMSQ